MTEFDPTARFKKSFFQECEELLASAEALTGSLQEQDDEALNELFRTVHTVKGGAGMFNFTRLVNFAHALENVLGSLRDKNLEPSDSIASHIVHGLDILQDLLLEAKEAGNLPADFETECLENLSRLAGSASYPAVNDVALPDRSAANNRYVIRFFPEPGLFRRGTEPLLIFRELSELGEIQVHANTASLPSFAQLDPTSCYLGWVIVIDTKETIDRIKKVFEFVEELAKLDISIDRRVNERRKPIAEPEETARPSRSLSSIRVDLERIDKLVNLTGEIAIVQAMLSQHSDGTLHSAFPELGQSITQLSQLIQGLQDSVMAIRAVPVSTILGRMPRLVRELAAKTGKQVELVMTGEDTEIDKTVIEQLGDPLLHMIRNAIDHGIELPEARQAGGKNPVGRINLSARQVSGQLVIELEDDGKGIDLDTVRRKALTKGLIVDQQQLSDEEAIGLIFQPGFSTAETVSDLSGRGVGMDVVRRNIQKLGGRVNMKTERDKGSKVTIFLPLTLAILSGMILKSMGNTYVLPIANIVECLKTVQGQIKTLPDFGEVLQYRNNYLPLIRLNVVMNMARQAIIESCPLVIITNDEDGNPLALAVDSVIGQQQAVIKSIRDSLNHIPGVSGASILGDGTVALILVLNEIKNLHKDWLTAIKRNNPRTNAATSKDVSLEALLRTA
jgi:two-component system, chemotaxis family, sensor kinase CheA